MVTSLLKHDRIRTTSTRAKELRGWADHLITLAKKGDLHARRQALSIVREKNVVHKLFAEAAERFGLIAGGYTRVIKMGLRPGDAAPMSLIQLVAEPSKNTARKDKADKKTETSVKISEKTTATPAEATLEGKTVENKTATTEMASAEIESVENEKSASEAEPAEPKKDA
jgi:large subunit ribosomal protein L17